MSWVDAGGYTDRGSGSTGGTRAQGMIEHMNTDHAEAQVLFCDLPARPATTEATMSAVDRYGFQMITVSPAG